jgi:large subunit ribosomal protein L24
MKIRRNDIVEVMSGKDSGKRGKVMRVDPKKSRVYVEGLNIIKRHERPRSLKQSQRGSAQLGGVIEKEGPIHVSNVMLVDPKNDRPTRVGRVLGSEGKLIRVTKRSDTKLEES